MGTCRKVRSAFARSGGLFTGTAREHQGADLGAGIKVSIKILKILSNLVKLFGVSSQKNLKTASSRGIFSHLTIDNSMN